MNNVHINLTPVELAAVENAKLSRDPLLHRQVWTDMLAKRGTPLPKFDVLVVHVNGSDADVSYNPTEA